jgi:NAD(P)-dependent dehydrogenase (short-subunit alcohol dehydrogenase family)
VLTAALLPALQRSAPSRVVCVSSVAARAFAPPGGVPLDAAELKDGRRGYNPWTRYGVSKLANVHHALELQARYGGSTAAGSASGSGAAGVTAVSLHPGVIATTRLRRSVGVWEGLALLPGLLRGSLGPRVLLQTELMEAPKSIAQGAATSVYAALAPDVEGGACARMAVSRPPRRGWQQP